MCGVVVRPGSWRRVLRSGVPSRAFPTGIGKVEGAVVVIDERMGGVGEM